MPYKGLYQFIEKLEQEGELVRVKEAVNPELEITEITDRITKSGGKALLFENNGTAFPLLINMFGSERRMCMALGRDNLDDAGRQLISLFSLINGKGAGLLQKIRMLPELIAIASLAPVKRRGRGRCQEVVVKSPDINIFPVMKCWPHDGGRFITLPVVHTRNPETGEVNAGMYRMQIFNEVTTGMHWHRHKTGASHYMAWKRKGERMPVAVSLGGDPVYTYAATAPLPEGMDEFMLAGYLRKKRVKMVKCLTQEIYVPEDADIILEGYVDPEEELAWEGPFGDHTGFYSLADWYPKFHVTCITHRRNAVWPSTIVGIPPQEDAMIGKATERLFLYPVKLTLQPDITDLHMPDAGVAHNLVLVKIDKKYPGQGLKVISALFGAGQMMFSKFIIVLDNEVDIQDYNMVISKILDNVSLPEDQLITRGPLDVLDHSSDSFSFGGKMGIDATAKLPEEKVSGHGEKGANDYKKTDAGIEASVKGIKKFHMPAAGRGRVLFLTTEEEQGAINVSDELIESGTRVWLFILDQKVELGDYHTVAWQILSNTDPGRDILIKNQVAIVDARAKLHKRFPRRWPNVVVSSEETIRKVDEIWEKLSLGDFMESPSLAMRNLLFRGGAEADRD